MGAPEKFKDAARPRIRQLSLPSDRSKDYRRFLETPNPQAAVEIICHIVTEELTIEDRHAERDRKSAAARTQRQIRRQQA